MLNLLIRPIQTKSLKSYKMKNKNGILWGIALIAIFLLSQDYLFITWEGKPAILGFPNWLAWFALVHLLFIFVFFLFSKKYWK